VHAAGVLAIKEGLSPPRRQIPLSRRPVLVAARQTLFIRGEAHFEKALEIYAQEADLARSIMNKIFHVEPIA